MLFYLPVFSSYVIFLVLIFPIAYNAAWLRPPDCQGAIPWICLELTIFVFAAAFSIFMPLLDDIMHDPILTFKEKREQCTETFEPILDTFGYVLKSIRSMLPGSNSHSGRYGHADSKKKAKNKKN